MSGQAGEIVVSRRSFKDAAIAVGMPAHVQDQMWGSLAGAPVAVRSRFGLQSLAWYGGGSVSMLAMGLFLGTSWAQAGSGVGLVLTVLYLGAFVGGAEALRSRGHRVPAGLIAGSAVALVPLAVFAFQTSVGLFNDAEFGSYNSFIEFVSGMWVWMELATLAVGGGLWWRHRVSFLLAPCTIAGWFLTMDLAAALSDSETANAPVSFVVTAALLGTAGALDVRGLRDEAFWIHLGGLLSAMWTLGRFDVTDNTRMFLVAGAGVAALAAGLYLKRRLHLSFGGVFLFSALSYLTFEVFGGSPVFALVLGALGVATVVGGIRLDRTARETPALVRA